MYFLRIYFFKKKKEFSLVLYKILRVLYYGFINV
jgi:hypothetical protein